YEKKRRRYPKKLLLAAGIAFNLALLGYFKYADFFIQNINSLFGLEIPLLHLALPLAISFFTFQQIAYLVDSYRGETREYSFLNYALFVTFFPQLIAGPIVHHAEMMPQFASVRNKVKNYFNIALGLFIFSIGLFKKVVIADTFAQWANQGFDVAKELTMPEAWATSLSYTLQLYFDFSGYTDMAIGAALLFNIKLPMNFFSPYKATNIQDFWRRWHITLSRFLRDYLYIPLGGNRKGRVRTYFNLFITFLLGGIWHGAGWTFVAWGALHGAALVVHRMWKEFVGRKLPVVLAWFITFNFVNIAWIFFRAKNFEDAMKVLEGMFLGPMTLEHVAIPKDGWQLLEQAVGLDAKGVILTGFSLLALILGTAAVLFLPNSMEWMDRFRSHRTIPLSWWIWSSVMLGVALMVLGVVSGSEFLYFNF
ncbi:MAG: MBOAT family protein, partial [Epsilonproteobacteria bacterium]|nr:MBOAT family protein [Campylobacterota bacterium]